MKRLKEFFNKGLELKGNYKQISYILGDEIGKFEGVKSFTNGEIKASVNVDEFKVEKIIDTNGTYLKYKGIIVVTDEGTIFADDGNVYDMEEFLNNYEIISKPEWIVEGKNVIIDNCVSRKVTILPETIELYKDFDIMGSIYSVNTGKGYATVKTRKDFLKIPFQCLVEVGHRYCSNLLKIANKLSTTIIDEEMLFAKLEGRNVTYITKSRVPRFKGDFWNEELRAKYCSKTNVEKAFDSLFKGQNREEVLFYFSFYFERDELMKRVKGEILTGEDINQVFLTENIVENSTLGNSCMMSGYRGGGRWKGFEKFKIYTEHKNCSCAIMRNDEGKIVARAMLWTARNMKDGKVYKIMDRIYTAENRFIEQMQFFAFSMGALCLTVQQRSNSDLIDIDERIYKANEFYIELDFAPNYKIYPYMDTFASIVADRLFADRAQYLIARDVPGNADKRRLDD